MNAPDKHHYIPAFYTKRWAGPDELICEFSRPYKTVVPKRVHSNATGFLRRLYTLRDFEPGLAQQVEENFFKPVDGWAADALALLEGGPQKLRWNSHNRSAWTRFILSLLLRCPEDIDHFRALWYEDFRTTDTDSEARYAGVREHDDPPTFADFLAAQPIAMLEKTLFEVFFGLVDNTSIGGTINEMRWKVLDTSFTGLELLTSDRPVIRTHNLKAPGGHIALPIGPTRLFIASLHPSTIQSIVNVPRRELVKESNRQVVSGAKRFVYGTNDKQLSFVQKWFGIRPQIRIMEQVAVERRKRNQPTDTLEINNNGNYPRTSLVE